MVREHLPERHPLPVVALGLIDACHTPHSDGQTGQVVHPRFVHTGKGEIPSWSGEGLSPDPQQRSPVSPGARPDKSTRLSICKTPKRNATICDSKLRTMNIDAPCGSPEDATYFAPWRYPGSAPVIDSCGVAGGVYQWQGAAAAGGDYQPTINARRGDLGSKLPKAPTDTVWNAGETVEVAWTHKAWHGGGELAISSSSARAEFFAQEEFC